MLYCKFCKLPFDGLKASAKANHTRWCLENPKAKDYRSRKMGPMSEETKQKIRDAWASGSYDHVDFGASFRNKKHTEAAKKAIRDGALKSTHRRLIRSIRPYVRIDGSIVMLDSSWEEALAKRLDELSIRWVRPEQPIKWIDTDGVERNYFPDFFLPDFDLYLDPKNPAAVKSQEAKIERLKVVLPNLQILKTFIECTNFMPGVRISPGAPYQCGAILIGKEARCERVKSRFEPEASPQIRKSLNRKAT